MRRCRCRSGDMFARARMQLTLEIGDSCDQTGCIPGRVVGIISLHGRGAGLLLFPRGCRHGSFVNIAFRGCGCGMAEEGVSVEDGEECACLRSPHSPASRERDRKKGSLLSGLDVRLRKCENFTVVFGL